MECEGNLVLVLLVYLEYAETTASLELLGPQGCLEKMECKEGPERMVIQEVQE